VQPNHGPASSLSPSPLGVIPATWLPSVAGTRCIDSGLGGMAGLGVMGVGVSVGDSWVGLGDVVCVDLGRRGKGGSSWNSASGSQRVDSSTGL
jgi:hypothetical protein